MKNLKHLLKQSSYAVMGLLALGTFGNAMAQNAAIVAESNFGGTQIDVQHTGTDIAEYQGTGSNISIMVWDGVSPGIGWDDAGIGASGTIGFAIGPDIHDPDIAMNPDGECFTVVYVFKGEVYSEAYQYDQTLPGLVLLSGPQLVSSGTTHTCKVPNIDAGNGGRGAIVWGEEATPGVNRHIFTRGVEICGSVLYPTVDISAPFSINPGEIQPDVSVYNDGSGAEFFNYTYVSQNGTTSHLIHQVEDANAIYAGATGNLLYNIAMSVNFSGNIGQSIQNPRIASQYQTGLNYPEASTIVFSLMGYFPGSPVTRNTMSYNINTGIHDLTPGGLNTCYNRWPAITWTPAGRYITAWEYNGGCLANPDDILSVKLDLFGTPVTTSLANYQWLNNINTGLENAVSLASRYAANAQIQSLFHSSNASQVLYKTTGSANPIFFREAAPALENIVKAYPNPAQDQLTIEADKMSSIQLYTLTGQMVRAFSNADLAGKSSQKIELSELSSGMYLLKVDTENGTYTEKISVQ